MVTRRLGAVIIAFPGGTIPGEYRGATQLAAAWERRYVAALRAKAKTPRHAQTRPGRVVITLYYFSSQQGTPRGVERTARVLGWVGDPLRQSAHPFFPIKKNETRNAPVAMRAT